MVRSDDVRGQVGLACAVLALAWALAAACTTGTRNRAPAADATLTPQPTLTPQSTLTPQPSGSAFPLYHEDFDGPQPGSGWSVGGPASTSWRLTAGLTPAPYNGVNCFGTSASRCQWFGSPTPSTPNCYGNREDSWAMTPPFALPAGSALAFSWFQWYRIEQGYDGSRVEVTTDGGVTWGAVSPSPGYNATIAFGGNAAFPIGAAVFTGTNLGIVWIRQSLLLSTYAGQTVRVRFRLGSDGLITDHGVYLDEVRIE